MAEAPQGRSRSDFESVEPLYDVILRGEQRSSPPLGALAGRSAIPAFGGASYPEIDAVRHGGPLVRPQVRIGQQWYREDDSGRANTLVPTTGPLISPETLAAHRRAMDRVAFMADRPFGGLGYGVAALMGAPPPVRDGVMLGMGALDTGMQGAASLGATVRGPIAPSLQQPPLPTLRRPSIRYGDLNARGQATGVTATVTEPMLGTGSKAYLDPPGLEGGGEMHRGHLLARRLGGTGRDMRNLVALTNTANSPQMSRVEAAVARRVKAGEVIEYTAKPLYGGALAPSAVLITAPGSRGAPTPSIILNPAGRPR